MSKLIIYRGKLPSSGKYQYSTQYSTARHSTAQHSTQHSTAQHIAAHHYHSESMLNWVAPRPVLFAFPASRLRIPSIPYAYAYSHPQINPPNLIPQLQRRFHPPTHGPKPHQRVLILATHPRERNLVPILQEDALLGADLDALLAALRLLEQTPVLVRARPADGAGAEQVARLQVAARGGVVGEALREGPEEVAAVGGCDGGGVVGFCWEAGVSWLCFVFVYRWAGGLLTF